MSNQKKQILVNEITFWKKNKLLPEHYCDFLMTLYTEGNPDTEEIKGNAGAAIKAKEQRKIRRRSIIFPLIAILLVVLLFTIKLEWVVIAIVGVAAVASLIAASHFAKKNNLFAPMLQLTAALLFLGVTVKVCTTYFSGNNEILYGLLGLNCLLWLVSGLKMNILYFTMSGGLGLAVMVASWFFLQLKKSCLSLQGETTHFFRLKCYFTY